MHFLLKAFKSYITIQYVKHAFLFHVRTILIIIPELHILYTYTSS